MSVLTDPSYGALARTAAAALGAGSPDIARAILAQWQCELGAGAPYPPPRNNPGNIARGLARDLGIPFTVAPGPNPQPGNPIVTYPTAAIGAQAYAAAIARMSRYRSALAAARAGDGLAFVRAIGSSGWGTGTSCMLGVYRGPGAPSAGGGSGAVLADYNACQATLQGLGIPADPNHKLTSAEVGRILHRMSPNYPTDLFNQTVAKLTGMTVSSFCSQTSIDGGQGPLWMLDPSNPNSVTATLFGSFGWVPGFAVNAGVVALAAYLVLSGLKDALGPLPADAAIIAT